MFTFIHQNALLDLQIAGLKCQNLYMAYVVNTELLITPPEMSEDKLTDGVRTGIGA